MSRNSLLFVGLRKCFRIFIERSIVFKPYLQLLPTVFTSALIKTISHKKRIKFLLLKTTSLKIFLEIHLI